MTATQARTLERLVTKANAAGMRIVEDPGSPYVFATSDRHPERFWRINPDSFQCSCWGLGMCTHVALYASSTGQHDRLVGRRGYDIATA